MKILTATLFLLASSSLSEEASQSTTVVKEEQWINARLEIIRQKKLHSLMDTTFLSKVILLPHGQKPPTDASEWEIQNQDFEWLEKSGKPISKETSIVYDSLGVWPCLTAKIGALHAGIRPAKSNENVELCWVVEPNSKDTLFKGLRQPYRTHEISDSSWVLDTSIHYLRDGWKLAPIAIEYRSNNPDKKLTFYPKPNSIRWVHGATYWEPLIQAPWYLHVPVDTIPSHQDPNIVWSVEPSPLGTDTFEIPNFGIARWIKFFRWKTPDSLVALALLSCKGRARSAIGEDSLFIEIPIQWNPTSDSQKMIPDITNGFRTVPQTLLKWGDGEIATSAVNFALDVTKSGMKFLVFKRVGNETARVRHGLYRHNYDTASLLVYIAKNKSVHRISRSLADDFKLQFIGKGERPSWLVIRTKDYWTPPTWGKNHVIMPEN